MPPLASSNEGDPARALARVCREARARVAQHVRLADMSLQIPLHDARRIEVVCNGLPLWHGQQLAVDATIVSPVRRDGQPRSGADARPATALAQAALRKRRQVVFGVEVGGRWSEEAATFVRLLARARAVSACRAPASRTRSIGAPMEWHPLRGRHCWSSHSTTSAMMAQCQFGLSSLRTHVGRSRLLLAACRRQAGECACGMHGPQNSACGKTKRSR